MWTVVDVFLNKRLVRTAPTLGERNCVRNYLGGNEMSEIRSDTPGMPLDLFKAAIGGPTQAPFQPEGGTDVVPLSPLGLDKTTPEPFPSQVSAQQGAGGPGSLTPGAQGVAADGRVEAGTADNYSAMGGPDLLAPSSGLSALTPDPSHGRPSGSTPPSGEPVGRVDHALGRDQSTGQLLNPALKAALAPRPGPFGKPSL
jgi:hypothetical protein